MTATPDTTRLALLADVAAGMSPRNAARKHGVGESTAYRWLRGRIDWRAAEFALAGGHWMPNSRGVQQWQPCFFDSIHACNINHQETPNAA